MRASLCVRGFAPNAGRGRIARIVESARWLACEAAGQPIAWSNRAWHESSAASLPLTRRPSALNFTPLAEWLAKKRPDVLVMAYNDHVSTFFFDHYSVCGWDGRRKRQVEPELRLLAEVRCRDCGGCGGVEKRIGNRTELTR